MALISLQEINIAFGGPLLLDSTSLQIEKKQRICLLGRNGVGKSTLMKIIAGTIKPDSGEIHKTPKARISYFSQDIPNDLAGSVFDIIAKGVEGKSDTIIAFKKLTDQNQTDESIHHKMDELAAWPFLEEIDKLATKLSLDINEQYPNLSGGQKRRVLLAQALISEPDLLLLDEPTNHLDINSIAWLEEYIIRTGLTVFFVTHDRLLLKRLATRIIELDRGNLVDWSCDYETFLERKQAVLDDEEKNWEKFDKKLAQEEIWLRKGIKARRTRNEGRVRALLKMRDERKNRRQRTGSASLNISDAQLSGKMVLEADDVSFGYDDQPIINNFNTRILRGDKIGIIGPNGCGKSTLVKLLLKKLQPSKGSVKHGTNLSITYYDQLKEQLDESKNVWENVCPFGEKVTVNGVDKHVISYLQDFLFTPERAKSPIDSLSGGERNRLFLARLFTQPSNFIILDEPTNDLDVETLELLEELLVNFSGTFILISHDRMFLNNVVTSTFVFNETGGIEEFVGGFDDWHRIKQAREETVVKKTTAKKQAYKEQQKQSRKPKLSYKEQKELETIPEKIDSLETEKEQIHAKMADPEIYKIKEEIIALKTRLDSVELELEELFERWEYLESIEE